MALPAIWVVTGHHAGFAGLALDPVHKSWNWQKLLPVGTIKLFLDIPFGIYLGWIAVAHHRQCINGADHE